MDSQYSSSQSHGEAFESLIKSAFPGASNAKRANTSLFDIEKKFDKELNLPTSIKTTKNDSVGLADACRIFSINEPFRLLILKYNQINDLKVPDILYEFLINIKDLDILRGNLPYSEVLIFHNKIKEYGNQEHYLGRKFSKEHKQVLLKKYSSFITLNPKIDSLNQRRLQASISIQNLLGNVSNINVFTNDSSLKLIKFKDIFIPPIKSGVRKRKN